MKLDFTIQSKFRREFFTSLIYAILVIPLTFIVPFELSFENGPLENFQVVMLVAGGIHSLYLRSIATDSGIRYFNLLCALIFFLLAARELSYGGVFFLEWEDENGRHYMPNSRQPWYPILNVVLTIYILMLVSLLRKIPVKKILSVPIPVPLLAILILGIFFATAGDHAWFFDEHMSQVFEELSEFVMYGILPTICKFYHDALSN